MGFKPLTALDLHERWAIDVDERELRIWNALGLIAYRHNQWGARSQCERRRCCRG